MPNIKKDKTEIKGFLIGSGFDRMFNLPNWEELVDSFSAFVKSNANINRNEAIAKINIINSMKISPSRHMQSIKNVANKHIDNEKLIDAFMKTVLNISNYKYDEGLFKDASSVLKCTSDKLLTTNTSNVFLEMDVRLANSSRDMSTGSFFPIHGNYFSEKNNETIMFEEDYLDVENYTKRMENLARVLQNINVFHIFGYSMNDLEILTKIIENKEVDIIYYFNYENDHWKTIIEEQFKSLFKGDRISFKCQECTSIGYLKNFNELLSNITKVNHDEILNNFIDKLEVKNA